MEILIKTIFFIFFYFCKKNLMKRTAFLLLFLSVFVHANEIITIDAMMFGIDNNKKLIVSNKNVAEINLAYPGIKTDILLDASYTFVTPVQTIQIGTPYEIRFSGNNEIYTLYFTELPIIYITTPHEIVDSHKVWASFKLIENNESSILSDIGIEFRGSWTQTLPKKSLEIEFWENNTGEDTQDFSPLGLRSDDDWNLQAMFNEPLRFHSKTGNELWKLFHTVYYQAQEPQAINGIGMVYSEMFLNNQYMGVYAVSEKIDKKQLKLKNHNGNIRGELYKGDELGNGAAGFRWIGPYDNNYDVWDGFEYKHPEEEIDWSNLYNLIDFVINEPDATFYNQYQNKFNIDNIVDYFIFINLLWAADNTGKNLYIAKYDTNESYFYVPWDLDGIFGTLFDGSQLYITNDVLTNGLYDRVLRDCSVNGFRDKVKTRWNEARQNLFTHTNLMNLMEQNFYYLSNNGVYNREHIAWNEYVSDTNHLNYISDWLTDRLEFLDQIFNESCLIGTEDFTPHDNLVIYPNPASNLLYFKSNEHAAYEVSIYDFQGKLVLKSQVRNSKLDISGLSNGVYMVQIKSGNKQYINKLIVSK